MQLKRIHIENFKGIAEAEVKFNNKFNLIIGDNGTGKTSILEAVAVGLGGFLAGIEGINAIHFTKDEIRYETEILGEGSVNFKYKTPIKVELEIDMGMENYTFIRQKRQPNSARTTVEPRDICNLAAKLVKNPESILPIISYQGFSRIANQKRDKWRDLFKDDFSRIVGYTDCLEEASNTKMLTKWCKTMEFRSWKKKKDILEYETAKNTITKFMGFMLNEENVKVYYDENLEELMYSDGKEFSPLRLLSSGFRTILGMVLDIAARMAILNPNLLGDITKETNGIVLIDEIDMHLHPKWQWKIVKALKATFPKVQFIATTHSPLIISSCKDEHLISMATHNSLSKEHFAPEYSNTLKGWQVDDVLAFKMHTGNRDPETLNKLKELNSLGRKKNSRELTDEERQKYDELIIELRLLLPEGDIGIEEAALFSIEDMLGETDEKCKKNC